MGGRGGGCFRVGPEMRLPGRGCRAGFETRRAGSPARESGGTPGGLLTGGYRDWRRVLAVARCRVPIGWGGRCRMSPWLRPRWLRSAAGVARAGAGHLRRPAPSARPRAAGLVADGAPGWRPGWLRIASPGWRLGWSRRAPGWPGWSRSPIRGHVAGPRPGVARGSTMSNHATAPPAAAPRFPAPAGQRASGGRSPVDERPFIHPPANRPPPPDDHHRPPGEHRSFTHPRTRNNPGSRGSSPPDSVHHCPDVGYVTSIDHFTCAPAPSVLPANRVICPMPARNFRYSRTSGSWRDRHPSGAESSQVSALRESQTSQSR